MNRTEFTAQITALVRELIPQIQDDYRLECEEEPGMQLTIGADSSGWSYQTGDNSFTGGAYGYSAWGIGYIFRDSDPAQVADDIASDLDDNDPSAYDDTIEPIFSE